MNILDANELGNKIKNLRKNKGFSQENLAHYLNVSVPTISRIENGEQIPDAIQIQIICNVLGIYESELFNRESIFKNNERIANPFKSNRLYMYLYAFNFYKKQYERDIFYLNIIEYPDKIEVELLNPHDNIVYSVGYMYSDDSVAFIIMENNKSIRKRLDICEIIINIESGVEGLMGGAYCGNSNEREVGLKKCLFSKGKVEFTDEMFNKLKLSDYEKDKLEKTQTLYLDILNM